jgi:hypothetical protein
MKRTHVALAIGAALLLAGAAFAVLGPNSNDTAVAPTVNYNWLEGDGTQALTVTVTNTSTDGTSLQQHTAYFVGGGSTVVVLPPGANHVFSGFITKIDCLELNVPASSHCDWTVF